MKGMGKGFGGMMDGMGGVPGLDGVMSVDINGREYLMTQEGLVFDPDTQMPFGVLHPETGEVVEITEEMLAGLSQMAMVELNGRPYLFVGGFLVDPQTQAVAFQVEQDGTVLDALTGEPCGMLEMDEEPVIRATSSSNKAQSQKSSRPGQSRSAFSFEDENLDARGWSDRARELMADDYYYQAAAAFGEALKCCEEERAVELDFECDLLRGRAFCFRKMREFKSLLEDAERLLGYDADDKEAKEWRDVALAEMSSGGARR